MTKWLYWQTNKRFIINPFLYWPLFIYAPNENPCLQLDERVTIKLNVKILPNKMLVVRRSWNFKSEILDETGRVKRGCWNFATGSRCDSENFWSKFGYKKCNDKYWGIHNGENAEIFDDIEMF